MRRPPPYGHGRFLKETLLLVYLVIGLYGATWISDDYDGERLVVFAYAGVPLTVLYYALLTLYPTWRQACRRLARALSFSLVLIYGTGHLLLINALTGDGAEIERSLELSRQLVIVKSKRGGLSHLYSTRW